MGNPLRQTIRIAAALGLLLVLNHTTFADPAADTGTVTVKFDHGDTTVGTLREGVSYFSDRKMLLGKMPPEIDGSRFTCRASGTPCDVTLDVSVGSTVYILVDSLKHASKQKKPDLEKLDTDLTTAGWTKLVDLSPKKGGWASPRANYQKTFTEKTNCTLSGALGSGFGVVAKNLTVISNDAAGGAKSGTLASKVPVASDTPAGDPAVDGSIPHIKIPQPSIKCLEILKTESGMMLGQTSEVVLTAKTDKSKKSVNVEFATSVGKEMNLARDEAMRFLRVSYPEWYVDRAEISFEDEYNEHDGGSIGTAIGTMTLSLIQGFSIDPDIAITGDINANGKVRAIGGVSAKIRGATASKYTLVAVPNENYDQLVDSVVYSGISTITDIQVLGISTLNDAVATVRTDRDPKLAQAIELFTQVQQGIKASPKYLKSAEAKEQTDPALMQKMLKEEM